MAPQLYVSIRRSCGRDFFFPNFHFLPRTSRFYYFLYPLSLSLSLYAHEFNWAPFVINLSRTQSKKMELDERFLRFHSTKLSTRSRHRNQSSISGQYKWLRDRLLLFGSAVRARWE